MRHIGTSVGGKILQKAFPSPGAKAGPAKAKAEAKDPTKDPAKAEAKDSTKDPAKVKEPEGK